MATVMVVDDVAANRDIVRMLLGYRGHDVIEARDGADALRLAHVHHPDVVVSDVLMPGIDGLELVHRLRSDPDRLAAQAPVIFYTANYLEPETRPIAEACGVSQVVLRSQDPHTLLEAVDTALAQGPVLLDVPAADEEFAQAHLHAVNAKLIEKVRALHDTERRFEAMAVASPVGIGILDTHGTADYINERLAQIMQMPQENLLGAGWLDCLDDSAQDAALSLLHGAGDTSELRFDHRIAWPDGTTRRLRLHLRQIHDDDDGRLAGGVLMVDDVTDLVSAEERLREEILRRQDDSRHRDAERLDSLRRMAGGTAHDFNNVLGAILGYTNLAIETINDALEDGTLPAETAESLIGDLQHVVKGGERAKGLTTQLLAFGRREIIQPAAINLNTLLRDNTASLRETAGPEVELILDLEPSLPGVKADPAQIAQALRSLVRNSAEAMPAGGTVTITTSMQDENVTVSLTDTGTGMPQHVLDRAFEPFFSTKLAGSTAGLGLSTSHGIISQAGGQLTLRSREGHGTTATFTLPALVSEAPPPPPPSAAKPDNTGGETLLLVDDESAVLQVSARILSGAGYDVLTAADAGEALRILEQHPGHVSALVTDVVMPGMNGRQLAKVAAMRQPSLSIVFVSGFAESLIDENGNNLEPGSTILAKPFDREALVSTVRGALNATSHR
ncbi:PAS domain S-box-containing protein [Actinoplanes lutulentus]|uniref:histidine kinase n=1 Tax=Actinoplanes lutulentus TaxID=1287878 RepID=A0A327ZM19_9ACTN|nr:response regulator [Actinoplanes lutulentus]MBB2941206.1 PAS domain S-box-containing protein [Actinoplanes lutulentus]RAK43515.1 PAS domain S-box-containing protein [Actinoplanes lutulentus]